MAIEIVEFTVVASQFIVNMLLNIAMVIMTKKPSMSRSSKRASMAAWKRLRRADFSAFAKN